MLLDLLKKITNLLLVLYQINCFVFKFSYYILAFKIHGLTNFPSEMNAEKQAYVLLVCSTSNSSRLYLCNWNLLLIAMFHTALVTFHATTLEDIDEQPNFILHLKYHCFNLYNITMNIWSAVKIHAKHVKHIAAINRRQKKDR